MPSSRLPALALLLCACACRSVSVTETPAARSAPTQSVKEEDPCAGGFIPVEPWLSEGLLVLGELHGTEELPRIAVRTACAAAAGGKTAWLALEWPRQDLERIESFLSTGDEAALLTGAFWRRDYQDGRSSRAMLGVLHEVRRMRAAGRDVRVLPFDVSVDGSANGQDRDTGMAAFIADARTRNPGAPMVLLVGNIHATRRLKIPRSMVWHLVKGGTPLKTLNVAASGGTAWMCGAHCGIEALHGEDLGPGPRIIETPEAVKAGYDGLWYVGSLTASPPAWNGAR